MFVCFSLTPEEPGRDPREAGPGGARRHQGVAGEADGAAAGEGRGGGEGQEQVTRPGGPGAGRLVRPELHPGGEVEGGQQGGHGEHRQDIRGPDGTNTSWH